MADKTTEKSPKKSPKKVYIQQAGTKKPFVPPVLQPKPRTYKF